MNKGTRIEVRINGGGWAKVTVKTGPTSSSPIIETYSLRNSPEVLVNAATRAKAKGAQGVTWGACSGKYWVGETF